MSLYIGLPASLNHQENSFDHSVCEWGFDCNDQRQEHRTKFLHEQKRCWYGVNCLHQFSEKGNNHNLKYSHPCRFADLCKYQEKHLTHESLNVSDCKYHPNCTKLVDPVHRSKFRHTPLPYFLIPCRDKSSCKNKTTKHRKKYSHGEKVDEPIGSDENSNLNQIIPCRWGSECRYKDDKEHCKRYTHLSKKV